VILPIKDALSRPFFFKKINPGRIYKIILNAGGNNKAWTEVLANCFVAGVGLNAGNKSLIHKE